MPDLTHCWRSGRNLYHLSKSVFLLHAASLPATTPDYLSLSCRIGVTRRRKRNKRWYLPCDHGPISRDDQLNGEAAGAGRCHLVPDHQPWRRRDIVDSLTHVIAIGDVRAMLARSCAAHAGSGDHVHPPAIAAPPGRARSRPSILIWWRAGRARPASRRPDGNDGTPTAGDGDEPTVPATTIHQPPGWSHGGLIVGGWRIRQHEQHGCSHQER